MRGMGQRRRQAVAEKRRGDAAPLTLAQPVAYDGDREMDFAGHLLWR